MNNPLSITTAGLLLCTIAIFSCTKETISTTKTNATLQSTSINNDDLSDAKTGVFKTYVIDSGHHFCNNNRYPLFRTKALYFTAVFNKSAIYHFTDIHTLYDQNTLYGFADNFDVHEQYSARFGWRWFNNELQIAAYANNAGDSTIVQIGAVPLNTEVKYGIVVNKTTYDFYLNGSFAVSLPRASTTRAAIPYKLFPYFGGDAVAPHKVTIKIREDQSL